MKFTHKYAAPAARMLAAMALAWGAGVPAAVAQTAADSADNATIVAAREAWRARDAVALLAARDQLIQTQHPLAPWADYWSLMLRLPTLSVAEADAFFARWPDSYVADRGRNDWLLELGRRQDWATFLRTRLDAVGPDAEAADALDAAQHGGEIAVDVGERFQVAFRMPGGRAGAAGGIRPQLRTARTCLKPIACNSRTRMLRISSMSSATSTRIEAKSMPVLLKMMGRLSLRPRHPGRHPGPAAGASGAANPGPR